MIPLIHPSVGRSALLWLFLGWACAWRVQAQSLDTLPAASSTLYSGYGIELSYNLYSRNRHPAASPQFSGQALNVLPGIGLSWWLGDVDHWTASVAAEWEWLPFQLSLRQNLGVGAWRLPLMARVQVPLWKQQSLWVRLSAGLGAQYQRLPWYGLPEGQPVPPAFWSGVFEMGLHLSAVGFKRQRLREVLVFARVGVGPQRSHSGHIGVRVSFWNRCLSFQIKG